MAIQSIVILTGAGISAESGIRTFRASDGLWEDHKVEDIATPEAFYRDPYLVHRFYNERRKQLLSEPVKPNPGHMALAELEKQFPGEVLLVTQNIDNLHERAGSRNLLHMHGELLNLRCKDSGVVYRVEEDSQPEDLCQCCGSSGNLRPDIVWFGEMPMYMEDIYNALENCDLFISVGTSGHVYPAAGFVEVANAAGAVTVELNLEPSRVESAFDHRIYGPASEVVPEFVKDILKQV
ncbi:Sir2 family NAD+-dependent deacetylase [Neptuniibacter sp.]|uniref:Sir2 family NAD+-dependent deacetylase n=1 Tax=Neptuniibacter sp. TaxID=1962643 RepID=UPI002623954B|nr:Sir2 family NAD+-dependent deacetylase [Neptuniibacter sp.]MCP4595470.1 NAD-dependent protein deacylase [Neptuniibacter sp.]